MSPASNTQPEEFAERKAQRRLALYKKMRERWLVSLSGDEHHSIWKQIDAMVWQDAVYRVINEARQFSNPDAPTAASNAMFGEIVDLGYVAIQVLAIWKLMDNDRRVISLRNLVTNIKNCASIITRLNYVTHDGAPYSPEGAHAANHQGQTLDELAQYHRVPTDGLKAYGASSVRHLAFDRLCGKGPEDRSPDDQFDEKVFQTIEGWLDDPVFNHIAMLRHNFVAHAADEKTRSTVGIDQIGVTLGQIESAHHIIVRTAQAISRDLLCAEDHQQIVPVPQFGQFRALDAPFVSAGAIDWLSRWWHEHMAARAKWTKGPFDLIPKPSV